MNEQNANKPAPKEKIKNPDHQKQTVWQIWVPLGICILIVLGLCTGAILSTSPGGDLGTHWASVSAILLIIPVMFFGLLFLVLLSAFIFLIIKMLEVIPIYSLSLREQLYKVFSIITKILDQSASPFISIQSKAVEFRTFIRHFSPKENVQD